MANDDTNMTGFMLQEHVEGEGEDAIHYDIDQRIQLPEKIFKKWAKAGLVEVGETVEMRMGVEGGRYSLAAKDRTTLPSRVAAAWIERGFCVPVAGEPSFDAAEKAFRDRERAYLEQAEQDGRTIAALKAKVAALANSAQEIDLALSALEGQALSVAAAAQGDLSDDKVMADLSQAIDVLAAMLPPALGVVEDE